MIAELSPASTDFAAARKAMIDSQLRTSGVNEPFVLDRMGGVAREEFVPESARGTAYMDRAIRLADGGALPSPLFHGMLLAEARPTADDTVVIVSGGSDYLAELVRPLVANVEVISTSDAVAGKAKTKNASLLLIDGAIEEFPTKLAKRLSADGRVVTGLVENGVTRLAAGRRTGNGMALVAVADVGAPRISAFDKTESWSF